MTTMKWITAQDENEFPGLPIKQVYCWTVTSDKKILIVSKDNHNWQFPGGKPESSHETIIDTVVREVREEARIDISKFKENIKIFGYYEVQEDSHQTTPPYLQIRTYLLLPIRSEDISYGQFDVNIFINDSIKFSDNVSINLAIKKIPWLSQSEEYLSIKKLSII